MSVTVHSSHPLDAPFRAVCANARGEGAEFGFAGIDTAGAGDLPQRFSAWLPGNQPAARLATLREWKRQGRKFRFFFPERHYAPAREGHALFTGGHLGTPIGLLVKVQAHPDFLLHPERRGEACAWLDEPVLNRIPLAVWMQGPVADVRVMTSAVDGADIHVVMLRHTAPARHTIFELSVSPLLFHGAAPAVRDRIEATGSDGFLRVTGIWQEAVHAPRLEVHRAATDFVQRDLRRDFAQVYEHAAAQWPNDDSKSSYALAEAYLDACLKIAGQHARRP